VNLKSLHSNYFSLNVSFCTVAHFTPDTTTATGRCFLSMMGAIHQMERELRAERASAGRVSAKARGRTGGRPRTDVAKLENARILYQNSEKTAAEVCRVAGVGRRVFFAYLAQKHD
jgi:DNA invertase Pin-like site-specific DNA recombinase